MRSVHLAPWGNAPGFKIAMQTQPLKARFNLLDYRTRARRESPLSGLAHLCSTFLGVAPGFGNTAPLAQTPSQSLFPSSRRSLLFPQYHRPFEKHSYHSSLPAVAAVYSWLI
jgi:hypothetical protein